MIPKEITLSDSSHVISDEMYGNGDRLYRISFAVNDAFIAMKSHSAEVMMLQVYSPDGENVNEGDIPYIAIQEDDDVYGGVGLFEETGRVDDASEVIPLSGKFMFRAKMEYDGNMMYFYGYKRCDDPYQCSGLCLVYPKEYIGTENEQRLMSVLDAAAESYTEELISGSVYGPEQEMGKSASVNHEKTHSNVLQTVAKTATIIKRVRLIAGLVIIAGILIYLLVGKISDTVSVHHIVQLNGSELIISEFTPDEQRDILNAFDVVIPANETNARLVSFMRGDRYEKITSYIIEIDGISDYDAFFAANSGRALGQSVNESDTRDSGIKYYITYHEQIVNDQSRLERTDNAESYKLIAELFSKMYKDQ